MLGKAATDKICYRLIVNVISYYQVLLWVMHICTCCDNLIFYGGVGYADTSGFRCPEGVTLLLYYICVATLIRLDLSIGWLTM